MKRTSCLLPAVAAALVAASASPAHACSETGYLAEICFMAGDYCPVNHVAADGAILPISSNTALFSLLGDTYGGNGTTTFGLPDLRGRSPVGIGPSYYTMVERGTKRGTSTTTLAVNQIPPHDHAITLSGLKPQASLKANNTAGGQSLAENHYPGTGQVAQSPPYEVTTTTDTAMASVSVEGTFTSSSPGREKPTGTTGQSQAFVGTGPRLGLTACIRTAGLYPPRN